MNGLSFFLEMISSHSLSARETEPHSPAELTDGSFDKSVGLEFKEEPFDMGTWSHSMTFSSSVQENKRIVRSLTLLVAPGVHVVLVLGE